jgi:hypothetical protein
MVTKVVVSILECRTLLYVVCKQGYGSRFWLQIQTSTCPHFYRSFNLNPRSHSHSRSSDVPAAMDIANPTPEPRRTLREPERCEPEHATPAKKPSARIKASTLDDVCNAVWNSNSNQNMYCAFSQFYVPSFTSVLM